MRIVRVPMALTFAAFLASAWAGVACGGQKPPARPERKPSAVEWDGSRLFEAPNGPKSLSGSVLRSPKDDDTTTSASSAISERCWLLALGRPYLLPAFDEDVLAWVRDGSPFGGSWKPQDRGAVSACSNAFGYGWRLPTLTEAQSAFEMRTLSKLSPTSVLVQDDGSQISTVRFEPKSSSGCRPIDPGCEVHVEFETHRDRWGQLYCVGPASALPAAEPSDGEIRQCVRRVSSEVARLDRSERERFIPEDELDSIFAMRRACTTQKASEFDAVAARLRDAADGVPLHRRVADLQRALAQANAGLATAQSATNAGEGKYDSTDCAVFRDRYEKICASESCLAAQVRYATRCVGADPTEKMERVTQVLAARVAELGEPVRRLGFLSEVGVNAQRCAKDPAIARRFADVFGEPPAARAPEPPCVCPIEALDCGISLLLDPDQCPASPPSARTPGACGCAKNDLSCSMKCAE